MTSRIRVAPSLQVSSAPSRPVGSRATSLEKISSLSLQSHVPPTASAPGSEHEDEDLSHIFAIGDVADTGAIQAGHTAYWQAEVAARNILRLIDRVEGRATEELEVYKPGPPAIKVTLGLVCRSILSRAELTFLTGSSGHFDRRRCQGHTRRRRGFASLDNVVRIPTPRNGESS